MNATTIMYHFFRTKCVNLKYRYLIGNGYFIIFSQYHWKLKSRTSHFKLRCLYNGYFPISNIYQSVVLIFRLKLCTWIYFFCQFIVIYGNKICQSCSPLGGGRLPSARNGTVDLSQPHRTSGPSRGQTVVVCDSRGILGRFFVVLPTTNMS